MINFNSSTEKPQSLLEQIQQRQDKLSEKLASGKQINSAADGAAAQQIIDRLTSEVEGGRQAVNNAYDGISLAQVAESGLEGINNDVNRPTSVKAPRLGRLESLHDNSLSGKSCVSMNIDRKNFIARRILSPVHACPHRANNNRRYNF